MTTLPSEFQLLTQSQKEAIELAFSYFDPQQTGYININPTLYQILYSVNGNAYPQPAMEEKVRMVLAKLEIYTNTISLIDTLKVSSHSTFNKLSSHKDIADCFQILKNVNGELSTQKIKKVLCRVFDKVEEKDVENLIGKVKTTVRQLTEEEQTVEDNTDGTITIISNHNELYDELRTRF